MRVYSKATLSKECAPHVNNYKSKLFVCWFVVVVSKILSKILIDLQRLQCSYFFLSYIIEINETVKYGCQHVGVR